MSLFYPLQTHSHEKQSKLQFKQTSFLKQYVVNFLVFSLSALGMFSLLLLLVLLPKENVKEERSTHVWMEIITKV